MSGAAFLLGIVVWAAMIPFFIVQGGLRETLVRPRIGELRAHQFSGVTGSAAIFVAVFLFQLSLDSDHYSTSGMLALGAIWVALTVTFEFGFGHFVMGNSWSKLLADYNITRGRLWIMVLLSLLIAPPLMAFITGS